MKWYKPKAGKKKKKEIWRSSWRWGLLWQGSEDEIWDKLMGLLGSIWRLPAERRSR